MESVNHQSPDRQQSLNRPIDRSANLHWRSGLAWTAHVYTALGAVADLLAALAITEGRYRDAFAWMALAVVIDASDGWWARFVRVREFTPTFDGTLLDNIVDYVTYVFVPALFVVWARLVPVPWNVVVAAVMLVASAAGFCRNDAKSPDHFFTGFPSYWNIVILYLFAARLEPAENAAVLLALAVLVFVPVGYVYPSRMRTLQALTILLGCVWGALVCAMIWRIPDVPRPWVAVSLLFPLYYTILSFALHARRSGSDPLQ